jgi:PAS domain S-box-containing protein
MPADPATSPDTGSRSEQRLLALQVEEVYSLAPTAAAFSYFGSLLTLGVLVEIGNAVGGGIWFLYVSAVTFFRAFLFIAYRRRAAGTDVRRFAHGMLLANLLAGVQWGLLGTLFFPAGPVYAQLFTLMVIICFIAGSVTAYAAVRNAHESLSVPATIPTSIYIFFFQTGTHWYAGVMALFFCFAIVFYARKLHRHLEEGFNLQIERDDLLALTGMRNEKLDRENRELAHRVAVRGVSVESARERADRLEALFERSALPQIECDSAGNVLIANPAAERLFGLRHEQIAGRPITELLVITGTDAKALAYSPKAEVFEVEARARGGLRLPCRASFTPLPAVDGRHPGFGVVLTGLPVTIG